ncbi:unnamed protein product [Rhizoctonia solani]|uniref:Uncharacterized protein n=1 Tax=Rhizoctonia solani TaxID=456999 RepID=A0A8H3GY57_9AGAM|nr:unnamed protein product [Rhizoctonia solani]
MLKVFQDGSYNPSLRVFGIHELATLICKLLSRRDNARLLSVCHQLSYDIRSFVWEHINAVEPLVRMIPETRVEVYDNEPFSPYVTLYLPKSVDFSRLSFYAPYIKYLDIPLTSPINAYENWDDFLASTRPIDLLPNLEHLKLAIPSLPRGETIPLDALNWVTVFLSSSLLSIQIYPDLAWDAPTEKFTHAWVSLDNATKLLRDISEKCHRLSSLMILPGDITLQPIANSDPRAGQITEIVPTDAVFSRLHLAPDLVFPHFNHLRKLSVTPFILESAAFRAIGELPFLESLSIREQHVLNEWPKIYCSALNWDLTTQSFPVLRYLDLLDITYDNIIRICTQKQLAQALHSLRPIIAWTGVRKNQLARLLSLLVRYHSPLARLSLPHIPEDWNVFPQCVEHLSCLKLTHLSMPQPDFEGFDYELAELLPGIPELISLELKEQECGIPLQIQQLRLIATSLPNLIHLSAPIDFTSARYIEEQDFFSCNPQSIGPFCLETGIHNEFDDWGGVLKKYGEKLARYLHALWPNIVCIAKNTPDFGDFSNFIRLNDLITQLRD